MAILASLPSPNLFSSLPSTPPPNDHHHHNPSSLSPPPPPPKPPIPIPKYLPPKPKNPALKLPHRRTKYYKPIKDGVISTSGDRAVVLGDSGVSYLLPGAPFEFQYSYSETPNVKPLAIREPAFLPFEPPTMPRPWTGKAPLKKSKKKIPLFIPPSPDDANGVRSVEMPRPFPMGEFSKDGRTREEVLGQPLKKWEIRKLIKPLVSDNRQVNLGRDGLTHNMLELVHTHWKTREVCKVRCKGVPTVDMDNLCRCLEEKTGGKIIHRVGGTVYLFRGRYYNYKTRPRYPVMLWKPAAPVYPKLIQEAPEGLTKDEAEELRKKGRDLLPICKLAKNGVYVTLVRDVRHAFEGCPLVRVDCSGMHATDYKKLGAKLKELVPCVLLSFDDEQILMWRGHDWKSRYPTMPAPQVSKPASLGIDIASDSNDSGGSDDGNSANAKIVSTSPKMMKLWKRALESSMATMLDNVDLSPDAILSKVEEFEVISQATEHSYPASVLSKEETTSNLSMEDGDTYSPESSTENDEFSDNEIEEDEYYDSDFIEDTKPSLPLGSLPIDMIAKQLNQE